VPSGLWEVGGLEGTGGLLPGDVLAGHLLANSPMVVLRGIPDDPSTWEFSANLERVLGWRPSASRAIQVWMERVHPEDRDEVAAVGARVAGGHSDHEELQFRMRRGDGGYRWLWAVLRAELEEATGRRFVVVYDLDITDRKLLEERMRRQNLELERQVLQHTTELERANAMLRAVIEGIADPVYVKDMDGRYVLANSSCEPSTGLPTEELVGRADHEIFPTELAARLRADERRVTASGLPHRFREEVDTSTGPRIYQAVKAPWRDNDGRIIGVVGVSRDVTEQERAAAARRRLLARLQDMQERERRRVAVDLSDGPVQGLAMLGYKLARMRALLQAGRVEAATDLLGECEADVTGEVAALRRTMRDLRPLLLDQHGLEVALREQAEAVRARAGLASCSVRARLDDARLEPGVETALFRVAQQALANVAEHAGAANVQVFLAGSAAGEVVLRIADDGCGFDPTHVQPVDAVDEFGLTAMRERVEAVGGRLSVRSRPGQGTVVEARVPGDGPTGPGSVAP
jgi:two-component system, NarL family, sensor histidine kinase UhpB